MKHQELINAQDEYIKLLEKEVSRVGGLSIPATVAKGEELRQKIKAIRNN